MSSELDPELEELLAPLREPERFRDLPAPAQGRVIAAMERQLRARPGRTLPYVLGLAAAAALAALWLPRDGRPDASETVRIAALGAGTLSWAGGDGVREMRGENQVGEGELAVPAGARAEVVTAAGVRVLADANTRLRVQRAEPDERAEGATGPRRVGRALDLRRGAVHCRVPKLAQGDSFVVHAAQTSVVVHGTDFSVELPDGAGRPCVRVREGLVEVKRAGEDSIWLRPGQSAGCPRATPRVTPAEAAPPEQARVGAQQVEGARAARREQRRQRVQPAARKLPRAAPEVGPASTLERENELLSEALRAERDGEPRRAAALFRALMTRYPGSPLVPEARAGLDRSER